MILPLSRLRPGSFLTRMGEEWWFWPEAEEILVARSPSEIQAMLTRVQAHSGWAAAVIRFDAAPAFDGAFRIRGRSGYQTQLGEPRPPDSNALPNGSPSSTDISRRNQGMVDGWSACFQLFSCEPDKYRFLEAAPLATRVPQFEIGITREQYGDLYGTIREALAAGDSYQVNGTFALHASFADEEAAAIFSLLCGPQPPPYAAFFHAPSGPILSLSPELFFERRGDRILSRPMKGTRPNDGNLATANELKENPKDQAENLMIVDMIRNDLGRIAKTGSVHVPHLFDVEDHGTVWQMTSTVTAETQARLPEILHALFPCASIVGAPKVETMRLIAESEVWGRGLYTGMIGVTSPEFDRFSVAIRTIETEDGAATYGVGSGVVWDSTEEEEWKECLAKAKILEPYGQELGLIETMRWEPDSGFLFLDRHLDRLLSSAHLLGIEIPADLIDRLHGSPSNRASRVKFVFTRQMWGQETSIDYAFCAEPFEATLIQARIVPNLVLSTDPWLRHKTTLRRPYELAARLSGTEEALLVNERGEATEFTIGNLVCQVGDRLVTPPAECGLLPGVYRSVLLDEGKIEEAVLTADEVLTADMVFRINSVRGFTRVHLKG